MIRLTRSLVKAVAAGAFLVSLISCGSQAPGPSTSPGSGSGGSTGPAVASIEIVASRNAIAARSGETVTLTVTALDASRKAIPSAPIQLSANSGIISSSATTTDTSGILTATFSLGQDRSNRTVTISATDGVAANASLGIAVTGTTLTLLSNPSTVANAAATARVSATVLDAAGQPLSGAVVTFGTTQGALASNVATTDATGVASTDISGISTSATVTAALGATTTTVQISASGQGSAAITPAGATITDFVIQANPDVVGTNQPGNTGNYSLIEVRVLGTLNGQNVSVGNAPVRFRIVSDPPLGTLEVDTTSNPALSNSSGIANNRFIAGATPSGTNAVVVCASVVGLTPPTIMGVSVAPCAANEKPVRLTIAQQALFVRMASNNEIASINNNLVYERLFAVSVTDAAGRGVPGVTVTPKLIPIRYWKGFYTFNSTAKQWIATVYQMCLNEDENFSGVLDAGDFDRNTDGKLWPGQAATISIDNDGRTDSTGFVIVRVRYGKSFSTWAQYAIQVQGPVGGSEGSANTIYTLVPEVSEFTNEQVPPTFQTSPFGVLADCTKKD